MPEPSGLPPSSPPAFGRPLGPATPITEEVTEGIRESVKRTSQAMRTIDDTARVEKVKASILERVAKLLTGWRALFSLGSAAITIGGIALLFTNCRVEKLTQVAVGAAMAEHSKDHAKFEQRLGVVEVSADKQGRQLDRLCDYMKWNAELQHRWAKKAGVPDLQEPPPACDTVPTK